MKTLLIVLVALGSLSANARKAQRPNIRMVVLDEAGSSCAKEMPGQTLIPLTSEQAATSLKDYLGGKSQDLGKPANLNEAWGRSAIQFCGAKQREALFDVLVEELRTTPAPPKLFVLFLQNSPSKTLLTKIDQRLAANPPDEGFKANLTKAKKLVEYQRKYHPAVFPSQKELREIEKTLGI